MNRIVITLAILAGTTLFATSAEAQYPWGGHGGHRALHRELAHERFHDALAHEAFHDHLRARELNRRAYHRAYHGSGWAPYYNGFGYSGGYGHCDSGLSSFYIGSPRFSLGFTF